MSLESSIVTPGKRRKPFLSLSYHILNLASSVFLPGSLHDELIGNQGDELAVGGLLSLVLLRSNRLIVYVFATCRILKFRLIHRAVCRPKHLLFLGVPR